MGEAVERLAALSERTPLESAGRRCTLAPGPSRCSHYADALDYHGPPPSPMSCRAAQPTAWGRGHDAAAS